MAGIFISYRRDDAAGSAGRLYDRLREHFGADQVFRDVDTIEPGTRFPHAIEDRLARCDVFLAVIGKRWLTEADDEGRRRLDDPHDFVRLEIATALQRDITVVPTLLDKAAMPDAEDLPPDLRPLAACQAIEVDAADFHDDVNRLIRSLESHVRPHGRGVRGVPRRVAAAIATALVLALIAAATVLWPDEAVRLRAAPAALTAEQARALIVERGFFSAGSNPGGAGLASAYEASVSEGVPVVVDRTTGLMWEQSGSRRFVSGGWSGATDRIRALNGGRHAGFDDWRLPTLDEALSLLRRETAEGFHIDPAFNASAAPFIWTADTWTDGAGAADRAWVVYYLDGHAAPESTSFNAYVRAVRSR